MTDQERIDLLEKRLDAMYWVMRTVLYELAELSWDTNKDSRHSQSQKLEKAMNELDRI